MDKGWHILALDGFVRYEHGRILNINSNVLHVDDGMCYVTITMQALLSARSQTHSQYIYLNAAKATHTHTPLAPCMVFADQLS